MVQTFESGYASTLSQKFSSTDTTMYVATPPTVTAGRVYLTDGSQKERVQFTGVSGSTLTGCVRGLSRTGDPSTAGVGLNRLAGNPVVLVAMHDQLRDKNQAVDPLIYGKTYATTAARDAALGGDGAATHPYTNVYVTATGLHYNYNLATALWETVSTGTATPNASTTVAGKVEQATAAEIMARTETGTTGAPVFINPKDANVINMTAGENLTAGNGVFHLYSGKVFKTMRGFSTVAQMGSVTGLYSSTTQNVIKSFEVTNGVHITIYKKSSDNKIYATATDINSYPESAVIVGTEVKISDDALETADGFDACTLYPFSSTGAFYVVYKKASDDKVYGVAGSVSGTAAITVGSATKLYDTNIVQSGTRPTCCAASSSGFIVGFHDDVTDNPTLVNCDVSGTTITPLTAVVAETVTMNAAGQVLVVRIGDNSCGVFYDDGTNISYNTLSGHNLGTVGTACDLTAGYVTGSMKTLHLENGRVLLFTPGNGNVRIQTVNNPLGTTAGTNYYNTQSDYTVQTDTTVVTLFDVCNIQQTEKGGTTKNGTPFIAMVNYVASMDGASGVRYRKFKVLENGLHKLMDNCISASVFTGISITQGDIMVRDETLITFIDTATTKLNYTYGVNCENRFLGIVQTTTALGGTVPIITSGPATISGLFNVGTPLYVGDVGAVNDYGTKQIGVTIGTDTILLK